MEPPPGNCSPDPAAPIVFRSKRKRPTLRSRHEEHVADATSPDPATGHDVASWNDDKTDDQGVSVAEVLRQRRRQARLRGAGLVSDYTSTRDGGEDESGEQGAIAAREGRPTSPDAVVGGITNRFAPQTGLVGELVNRHM